MSERLKASIRRNKASGRQCEVSACFKPVQKVGRLCDYHDAVEVRTGHPLGRTILAGELAPYLKSTSRYIKQHQQHPAIAEAIRRIVEMVHGARRRNVEPRSNATAHERLSGWLDRLERGAVPPEQLLAIVAAMFFLREDHPRTFPSDRYFRHQLAIRFLRQAPAPVSPLWRGGAGSRRYDRITVATRELLASKLESAIGLVALNMAKVLHQVMHPYSPEQQAAIRTPLPSIQEKKNEHE